MADALLRRLEAPARRGARRLARSGALPRWAVDALLRARRAVVGALEHRRQRRECERAPGLPLVALVVLADRGDRAALARTLASIRRQTYRRWAVYPVTAPGAEWPPAGAATVGDARVHAPPAGGDAAAACAAALDAGAAMIAFVPAGDVLAPGALFGISVAFGGEGVPDVVYTDEARLGAPAGEEPAYKPDWSPEYVVAAPYTGRLTAYRADAVRAAGGPRPEFGTAAEYDLLLRLVERGARVAHVREVLYLRGPSPEGVADPTAAARAVAAHLARTAADATCEDAPGGGYRVRYGIRGAPLVSVVIPTAGMTRDVGGRSIDLLANCVRSIAERTDYPHFEIVYVDNGDLRADTREALASLRGLALRAVTYTGPFNVADKMNLGARHAAGEHLLFLNDDVEVIGPGWMRAMLEYSQQPGVGAVGAKLYFPNDAVQHAGVIIPPVGSPAHVYHAFPPKRQAGIADLGVVRNYSAVTGACLMTRAEVFADLGGFDVGFPVNYNDVDYCLKVRERGLRVVFTPYAELYHFESLSRVGSADHGIRPEELARFAGRWGHVAKRDPYHDMRRTSVWLGA